MWDGRLVMTSDFPHIMLLLTLVQSTPPTPVLPMKMSLFCPSLRDFKDEWVSTCRSALRNTSARCIYGAIICYVSELHKMIVQHRHVYASFTKKYRKHRLFQKIIWHGWESNMDPQLITPQHSPSIAWVLSQSWSLVLFQFWAPMFVWHWHNVN